MPDGSDGYAGMSAEGPISMRQRSLDPMCLTRVVPACRRAGPTLAATCDPAATSTFAWPSRRVAQVARRFHERYQNGTLSSICKSDYASALQQVVGRIQPRLRSRCLSHSPVAAPAPCEPGDTRGGCYRIPGVVREVLPAGVSSSAACTAARGRAPGDRDPTLLRDTGAVQQVALPRGAAPPGDREGFYYDTRPATPRRPSAGSASGSPRALGSGRLRRA